MSSAAFISFNSWRAAVVVTVLGCSFTGIGPSWAQEKPKALPLVWVLSTGGTIAGRGASSTSLSEYKSGALLGEELVRSVPEIKQYANVNVEQIINVNIAVILDFWHRTDA